MVAVVFTIVDDEIGAAKIELAARNPPQKP